MVLFVLVALLTTQNLTETQFLSSKFSFKPFKINYNQLKQRKFIMLGNSFGEGFDELTVLKMIQAVPKKYNYDFVVIGSNPGGVACAREASSAGKKTAIVTWKSYSPAEAEGFDEDLSEMAAALDIPDESYNEHYRGTSPSGSLAYENKAGSTSTHTRFSAVSKGGRKVRQSRLDLNNELFKRGKQCRKLMHNAVRLGDLVEDAWKSGWRVTTTRPPLSVNWNKMSEEIMDYMMKENWALVTDLGNESVEIIEGSVVLEDPHTVKVVQSDLSEIEFTSEIICLALPTECILPADVAGARRYGITCDDFIRLSEPPGKTLVVGSLPESMECAGIVACSRFPVTVVSRTKILQQFDSEISQMIMDDMRSRGVVFKEETNLISVELTPDKKLMATFRPAYQEGESKNEMKEVFDTILFAVGRKVFHKTLDLVPLGIEVNPVCQKITADNSGQTAVPHIYAVGEVVVDCPDDFEVSQLGGKLLGKRLFQEGTELMDYSMVPTVIYTPTEYACVGISEDAAVFRLGKRCVDVYYGYFKPLDFVIPSRKDECFAKVIVLKSNEEIIGLHIYGPEAGEIIQGFAVAMKNRLTLKNFRTVAGITATKAQEILKLKEMKINKSDESDWLFDQV